jgi:histidine racemase
MAHETLITAAGGNGTAIQIIDQPLTRSEYEHVGKDLGERLESDGAEQAGFLVLSEHHFEMAGGEFCGNASRAAAMLFAQADDTSEVSFTVSGFDGTVTGFVTERDAAHARVRCVFPGMPSDVTEVTLDDGTPASIVDLGGIVHVVIEASFPTDPAVYQREHRAITEKFNLGEREAVGVVWFERTDDGVQIQPVVWVKAVDTFFHETSCGSGTIAVGKVTHVPSITQPTGQSILAEITDDAVVLESEMEVVTVEQDQGEAGV